METLEPPAERQLRAVAAVTTLAAAAPCRYGSHRVIEPAGALPQAAWRLDNTPIAARQRDPLRRRGAQHRLGLVPADRRSRRRAMTKRIAAHILGRSPSAESSTTRSPGSGGMFVGRVRRDRRCTAGARRPARGRPDRLARLAHADAARASTTVRADRPGDRARLGARPAVLFESGALREAPPRHPRPTSRSPSSTSPARRRKSGGWPTRARRVVVIGADGKSGHARLRAGEGARRASSGRVIGIAPDRARRRARACCSKPGSSMPSSRPTRATRSPSSQRSRGACPSSPISRINCVNVPGTELASILCDARRRDRLLLLDEHVVHGRRTGRRGRRQRRDDGHRKRLRERTRRDRACRPCASIRRFTRYFIERYQAA